MRFLSCLYLCFLLCSKALANPNYCSPDITVIENNPNSPLLLVTVNSYDNNLESLAMIAALNNYLFRGIPGVGSGQPLLTEQERNSHYEFFRRIFNNKSKYGMYATDVQRKGKIHTNDYGEKEGQFIVRFEKNAFDHALANEGILQQSTNSNNSRQLSKPSIMIIPFDNLDENIETKLRKSPHLRNAITAVQDIFTEQGYTVVDFFALYDSRKNDRNFGINNTTSFIKTLIQKSDADIYVTLDGEPVTYRSDNYGIDLSIKAYYKANGVLLASKTASASSNRSLSDLYKRAIYNCGDDFMSSINNSFQRLHNNKSGAGGQYIKLIVEVDNNASLDLDSEIGNDLYTLGDYITEYIKKNTRGFKLIGMETHLIQFDSIVLPNRDKGGASVEITDFATALTRFLRSKGVKCKRVIEGITIRIIITG